MKQTKNKKMKLHFFILTLFFFCGINAQKTAKTNSKKIIIEAIIAPSYTSNTISISYTFPQNEKPGYNTEKKEIKIENGRAKWDVESDGSLIAWGLLIDAGTTSKIKNFVSALLEPEDHIYISYQNNKVVYSGKGSVKFELEEKLAKLNDSLDKLPACDGCIVGENTTNSLDDYLYWNNLMNKKLEMMKPVIESYKSRLTIYAYNFIKDRVFSRIEDDRIQKFILLTKGPHPDKKLNSVSKPVNHLELSNSDLIAIYDSTMNGPAAQWLQFERLMVTSADYTYTRLFTDLRRQKGKFFRDNESVILGDDRFTLAYNLAKQKYKGEIREATLAYMFWKAKGVIYQFGFTPEIEALLADYYAQSKYPKFTEYTRKTELEWRERYSKIFAAGFSLTDTQDKTVNKEQLKGKVAVLDFWFTGCVGCVQMAAALRKVEDHFKNDTDVVFLSVSIDKSKEQWRKSVASKKYTSGTGVQLYTDGLGKEHDIIKKYGVTGYPTVYVIDGYDRVLWADKVPDARSKGGRGLIELINKQLAFLKDGPYVFHENNNPVAYIINSTTVKKANTIAELKVTTDQNTKFKVALKKELKTEPSVFPRPEKMLVLSDIEGNFEAFRRLLYSNGVIDERFNWAFGNGHLVFAGDMFDRGMQVTECLWLTYSLEEKAKENGGYVHFVLGNHEIMNLQGDDDYVQKKYKDNAKLMGITVKDLYNEDSELGSWLRTKNIMEKIGDLLFAHGGISRNINQTSLTIQQINDLAKPYYAINKKDNADPSVNVILSSKVGPFWYRGYYADGAQVSVSIIDSTLQKFKVARIITGHTIVADTISVHYGGKVINTDTKHAEGKSKALLIEGDHFYRVNDRGERVLLFVDRRRGS